MAYMTDTNRQEMISAIMEDPAPVQTASPALMQYRIRRSGGRPLVFRGIELGMAMSFSPALPYWYEINLFRTVEQTYVVAVKQFHQSSETKDSVRAWTSPSLGEALDKLEAYDPAADIEIGVDAADTGLCAAELAAHAMDLRARVLSARAHFSGLLGEFMHELDNG